MTEQELAAQWARLRRTTRVLLAGAAAVLAVSGVSVYWSLRTASATVIEARKFVVRDEQGRRRASLGIAKDGSPVLALADADDHVRVWVTVHQNRCPVLRMYAADGKELLSCGLDADDAPFLTMVGATDHARLLTRVGSEEGAVVDLYDRVNARARLRLEDGKPNWTPGN